MGFLHFPGEAPQSAHHFHNFIIDVTVQLLRCILICKQKHSPLTISLWHLFKTQIEFRILYHHSNTSE